MAYLVDEILTTGRHTNPPIGLNRPLVGNGLQSRHPFEELWFSGRHTILQREVKRRSSKLEGCLFDRIPGISGREGHVPDGEGFRIGFACE